jgi:pentatricopeptide repeat protein
MVFFAQVQPNLDIMNNLMRAYLASGLTFKVAKTFEEMEAENIAPNVFTLNFLVEVRMDFSPSIVLSLLLFGHISV